MDKFSRCFFTCMTLAVGLMFVSVLDRGNAEMWLAGTMVYLMFAMFTLVAGQLYEQWTTPGYHSKWMRALYNRWHKRA